MHDPTFELVCALSSSSGCEPARIIFINAPINAFLNYLLVYGLEHIRLGFSILYDIFIAPPRVAPLLAVQLHLPQWPHN
ncbi:hypothetical protein BDZ89DRAFT_326294 [Hymenopellis radicata]|nr:hypothetical protein BDZ89DRAFT_326294 [Hymenopellis radicata]